ncbi:MAG: hypothetical protein EP322_05070 [Bacteroidetes bacterium]|nr:MAG: hypothetical protein EP322_05070 [Bacteroidota bacterium]
MIIHASFAQIDSKDKAIIDRILSDGWMELKSEPNYFRFFDCWQCTKDSSEIFAGKVDGAILNHEYVLYHHPISYRKQQEQLKYVRIDPVTVREYLEFEKWVRDSIAMECYFNTIDEPNYDAKFMIRDKKKVYYRDGKVIPASYMYRDEIRHDITFDHKHIFHFEDPMIMPFIAHMYLPYPQRFYNKREFDKRKFNYHYEAGYEYFRVLPYDSITQYFPGHLSSSFGFEKVEMNVPIIRDEFSIARISNNYRDIPAVYSLLGDILFKDLAAYGTAGFQADAFCDWKTKMLQREFHEAGLDYVVVVTLPTEDDITKVPIGESVIQLPTIDMSEQWRITNREYKAFLSYVRDSINKEFLYYNIRSDHEASKMLLYLDYYFGEGELEFVEFDCADRELNRILFTFDPNRKIKRTIETDSLLSLAADIPLSYRYMEYNAANHAIDRTQIKIIRYKGLNGKEFGLKKEATSSDSIPYAQIGKDLQLGTVNLLGETNAIRSHIDYSRFLDRKSIILSVNDPEMIPDNEELLTSLSYEEALAYYNWRYPIQKANEKSYWQEFIYPSKEQYELILEGKSLIFPAQTLNYPTPLFRYAVHIYER